MKNEGLRAVKRLFIQHLLHLGLTFGSTPVWLICRHRLHTREYRMIYKGPGFPAVIWFSSSPIPSPLSPVSNLCRRSDTQEDWERETTCWREGGRGVGEEPNQESLVLYLIKYSLFYIHRLPPSCFFIFIQYTVQNRNITHQKAKDIPQRLYYSMGSCLLIGWDSSTTHLGSNTRALLVSQDRRHLFVTPSGKVHCCLGIHSTVDPLEYESSLLGTCTLENLLEDIGCLNPLWIYLFVITLFVIYLLVWIFSRRHLYAWTSWKTFGC